MEQSLCSQDHDFKSGSLYLAACCQALRWTRVLMGEAGSLGRPQGLCCSKQGASQGSAGLGSREGSPRGRQGQGCSRGARREVSQSLRLDREEM